MATVRRRLRDAAPRAAGRAVLDVAPTVALVAIGVAELAVGPREGFRGPAGASAAFLIAVSLPLLVRRRHPAAVVAAVFLVQAAWIAAYYGNGTQPPFEPFAAGVVACFALGFHADARAFRAGVGVFGAVLVVTAISLAVGGSNLDDSVPALIWWAASVAIGRVLQDRQALVELLRERSLRLERDRERDVAVAAAEERARIARELHDVIAHSVSLMVVQATAERRLLGPEEERTGAALATIEEAGREALGELRRLLGVLRARGGERLAPQPGLDQLGELVDDARAGGQAIELEVEGEPVRLPPGLDLTAYRIAQEALTNARRHAPGATAHVTLRWRPDELVIEVVDEGSHAPPAPRRPGHGLIGMRERVALYGGSVEAGPADGGFRVRARLPLEPAALPVEPGARA